MTFAPYGNIDLKPMYDYLKVLNIRKIFLLETGKFLYKYYNNDVVISNIGGFFEPDPHVNQHSYGLRSRSANIPTRLVCRTKSSDKSMQVRGQKLWKNLPDEITDSVSFNIFKRSLKDFLLEHPPPQE